MTADERTRELNAQQRDDELPSLWQYKCGWCGCDTEGGSDHRECECCRDLPVLATCYECAEEHLNEPSVMRQVECWEGAHDHRDYPSALLDFPHAEMQPHVEMEL